MENEDEVFAAMQGYADAMKDQVNRAGGWPDTFSFREPVTDAERLGLQLFIAGVEKETGTAVTLARRQ